MSAAEFLNALAAPSDPAETRRSLRAMGGDELVEIRSEVIRRLAAGELQPATALEVLSMAGAEPAVPDLVRLLRSAEASVPARAAALLLLRRHTTYDVEREIPGLAGESLLEIVEAAMAMRAEAEIASQKGTPFERLALADPEDEEVDIDEIVDELIESFCASPEASAVEDRAELRFWAGELVRLGVAYGHGSPARWGPGDIDEMLTELLPRKLTIESAAEAEGAVPAFRTFFQWASRVAPMVDADAIDAALEEYEADFPSMMMDERRFGPAKSFVMKGAAAGFDMSTEEGLQAFAVHHNRQHAIVTIASRKKIEAAKKRKAKMEKLSRKRNRRKK